MATIIREEKASLSVLVSKPALPDGEKSDALIVLLHGWGSDGSDLISLAPNLAESFPKTIFVAPDAPEPCSANPMGKEWFDLTEAAKVDEGPYLSQPILLELIAVLLKENNLKYERLGLLGFSQGAMMALHVGLRLPEPPAGIVSFAGALLAPLRLASEKTVSAPVLLIHGDADEVVPVQALSLAETSLKNELIEPKTLIREGLGHGIDPEGLNAAKEFLLACLK